MIRSKLPQKMEVLVKGSIDSIINNKFDGLKRIYLLQNTNKNVDVLLRIIAKLQKVLSKDTKIVFEAKYRMGYRDKRIDIAIWNNKNLILCKFVSDRTKIDKGALYLDAIISRVREKLDAKKSISGCVISKNILGKIFLMRINKILTNKVIFVRLEDIFKAVKLESIFGASVI